jgi:hypothetical protein
MGCTARLRRSRAASPTLSWFSVAAGLTGSKYRIENLGPLKIWAPVRPHRPHSCPPGPYKLALLEPGHNEARKGAQSHVGKLGNLEGA